MSIRFRCENCGQKLRVGDEKVGLQAKCPKCKASVTVPPQSQLADEPPAPVDEPLSAAALHTPEVVSVDTEPRPAEPQEASGVLVLPEIHIKDDSADWVSISPSPSPAETMIDYDKVAVPRRVLYLQGGLLGIVALVSFVLGMLVGGGSQRDSAGKKIAQACVLSGHITYARDDSSRPDEGSVVIVLPVDRRPAADARMAIDGLRPGDPIPADEHISLRTIRSLGGDLVRANDEGNYQVRLPEQGRYHVLFISRRAARSGNERLEMTDVAQIGRYFSNVVELLDDRKYQWRTLSLHGNTTLDATF